MFFRFLVFGRERESHDAQERIATLQHRLKSLSYWNARLNDGRMLYYFRDEVGSKVYALFEVENFQSLDWLLKRDPAFPYLEYECQPVVSTRDLIHEIQDFIGESYFNDEELKKFEPHHVEVDQEASYVLVDKRQAPFSPLLSEEIQLAILRKTVSSQSAHDSEIEICDVNPVGSKIGVHVSRVTSVEAAQRPVEATAIFPDTEVTYVPLRTISQARTLCMANLASLGVRSS
jgi:muconolactone delta-isomerase